MPEPTEPFPGYDLLQSERNRVATPSRLEHPFFTPSNGDTCVLTVTHFMGVVDRVFQGHHALKYRFLIKYFKPGEGWSDTHTWDCSRSIFQNLGDILLEDCNTILFKRIGSGLDTRYLLEPYTVSLDGPDVPFRLTGLLRPGEGRLRRTAITNGYPPIDSSVITSTHSLDPGGHYRTYHSILTNPATQEEVVYTPRDDRPVGPSGLEEEFFSRDE